VKSGFDNSISSLRRSGGKLHYVLPDSALIILLFKALLHATLDRSCLSVEKFSRWLRAICTILLCRNNAADRIKALGYVEQAFAVMDASGDDPGNINEVRFVSKCDKLTAQTIGLFEVLPNGRTTMAPWYIL
jgi:hypothetical protein